MVELWLGWGFDNILNQALTSKKNCLKKFVQCPMTFRRIVGKNTVKKVPSNLLPSVIETVRAPLP